MPFIYWYPSSSPRAHCTPNKSVPTLRYTRRHGPIYIYIQIHARRLLPSAFPGFPKIVYWTNFCFANIVRSIRPTATKLYSGSQKLRLTCSGNIRPIRRTLPLIGWEQSSPVNEEEIKIKMDDGVARYFTRFRGNWPICWLVGGAALFLGPRMM